MRKAGIIILILWLIGLIAGAKYLQHRAENLESEWIMDDHRLYQVVDGRKVNRLDVDLAPLAKN